MTDLFAAQSLIVARLNGTLTEATAYDGSLVIGANSQALVLPAVIVAPGEATVPETAHSDVGGAVWESHNWRVGVRVKLDTGAAAASRAEPLAGALVYEVIQALKGWRPTTGHQALRYVGRDAIQYETEAGHAEVWTLFNTVCAIA